MKSINRLYNKKRSHYYTILSKQGHKTSKRLQLLGYRNNRRLGEYLNQYVNFIITYCLLQGIGKIVVGEGHLAQDGTRLGDANFVGSCRASVRDTVYGLRQGKSRTLASAITWQVKQ